jgi:hypothetical protein
MTEEGHSFIRDWIMFLLLTKLKNKRNIKRNGKWHSYHEYVNFN